MNNILSVDVLTPREVAHNIASRVRQRRLDLNLTQEGLAVRADVNIATYRRFERNGQISLENLLKIAFALNLLHEFDTLFTQKLYTSIDEIINDSSKNRKRGKIT